MRTHHLDARGLICPLPVLKARKILLSLPPGSLLTVSVTDGHAPKDFELFCAENGFELHGVARAANGYEVKILKPLAAEAAAA